MKSLLLGSALALIVSLSSAPGGKSVASAATGSIQPAVYSSAAPASISPVYWRRYRAYRPYYNPYYAVGPYNYGYYGRPYAYGSYYRPYYGGYYGNGPYYTNYYNGPMRPYGAWRGAGRYYW